MFVCFYQQMDTFMLPLFVHLLLNHDQTNRLVNKTLKIIVISKIYILLEFSGILKLIWLRKQTF